MSWQEKELQATARVKEVYLRRVDICRVQWQDRAQYGSPQRNDIRDDERPLLT